MKKLSTIFMSAILVLAMLMSMSGCGEKKEASKSTEPNTKTSEEKKDEPKKDEPKKDETKTDETKTDTPKPSDDEKKKVEMVSDSVNGVTLSIPNDLSQFYEKQGIMIAMSEDSTASISISAPAEAQGAIPASYTEETYQASQMTTYTDVEFLEFSNNTTLDGVPTVFAHTKGTNTNGVRLELYNFLLFFENGTFQSIAIICSEGSTTSLYTNIQQVVASIKISK